MSDKRIGTRTGDTMQWPELDCYGQRYERPASTVGLSDTHFCVVPVNFQDTTSVIEELRTLVKGVKK